MLVLSCPALSASQVAKRVRMASPLGAGRPPVMRSGYCRALQVRILFYPLSPCIVEVASEVLAPRVRGAGLECRWAGSTRSEGSTPSASAWLRGARRSAGSATWPSGEAPVCKAGYAGSVPAVVCGMLSKIFVGSSDPIGRGDRTRTPGGAHRVPCRSESCSFRSRVGTSAAVAQSARGAGLRYRRLQVRILPVAISGAMIRCGSPIRQRPRIESPRVVGSNPTRSSDARSIYWPAGAPVRLSVMEMTGRNSAKMTTPNRRQTNSVSARR